jgi:Ni,Fe-hydrogenase III large subunit
MHTFPNVIILLQNQKLTLLCEVERKRSHLAALKKRYEEVKHLSEQSQLLSREKEKLGSLMGKL